MEYQSLMATLVIRFLYSWLRVKPAVVVMEVAAVVGGGWVGLELLNALDRFYCTGCCATRQNHYPNPLTASRTNTNGDGRD
jgi:hypothetical protein